jgi:glycosyltransferase involved in cell wall biosynthesis
MKTAFISTQSNAPWAASEFLWGEAADLAIRSEHDVLVSSYRWQTTPAAIQGLIDRGARYHRRRLPTFGRLERRIDRWWNRWRHLRHFDPDVVCISQAGSYDALVGPDVRGLPDALYALNKPYVLLCNALPEHWTLNDQTRARGRKLFAGAHKAVFVSQRNREIAERHLAMAVPNSILLHAPANVTEPLPLPWPADQSDLRMAIIGRLDVATKAHDVLLEALGGEAWRDRNWRLRIYGDGPDRTYLAELATHYGIGHRVDFPGHVENLRDVWAANHLLVMPSRHESGPLVVVEAALYGRPVVATDVGLVEDWVDDGKTGFVVPATTRSALAAGLERAWASREQLSQMGLAAHAKGMRLWERTPGQVLLNELIAAHAAVSTEGCEWRHT